MNAGVGEDDHDVGVAGEEVDVGREGGVAHFHALELGLGLAATVLNCVLHIKGKEIRRGKF